MAATREHNIFPDNYDSPRPQYADEVWLPSAARTTDDSSDELGNDYDRFCQARVQLDVTAVTGTDPTLDVVIEDTLDGTNWNEVAAFEQQTGTATVAIDLDLTTPFSRRLRVSWTLGGTTPDFTFSVRAALKGI